MSTDSKLTNDQILWLKDVLHPGCNHLAHSSFLTDILYYTVKVLDDMGKTYKDLPICYHLGAGMGYSCLARRLTDKSKLRLYFHVTMMK